jgi:3-dehydroquinate dehydratase
MFDEWHTGSMALRVGTGATGEALKELEGSMKTVAGTVTQSVGSVGTAMAELATRTGQTGKPLEALTKSFLDLERITGEATAQSIPALTRLFGDWSVATEHQAGTMDKLFLASQNTGVGVTRLAELMVQFGSPLRQLGIDFDFAAGMFAKFEQEGVNIQTTMPGLRMALKNFAKDGREPAEALQETFEAIENTASVAEANTMAFEVFGVRAGPDMAAAIREGRFELDDLIVAMNSGSDSISAAAEDTLTLSDKLAMLRNNIVSTLGPFGELGAVIGGSLAAMGPFLLAISVLGPKLHIAAAGARAFSLAMASLPFAGVAAFGVAVVGLTAALAKADPLHILDTEKLDQELADGTLMLGKFRSEVVLGRPEVEATAAEIEAMAQKADLAASGFGNLSGGAREVVDATEEAGGATGVLAENMEDLRAELDAAKEPADALTLALEALAGVTLNVNDTERAWLDTLADVKAELKKGAKTLDIHTQAGRDNQQSIRDGIDAAFAHGAAVAEETGSVEEGARAIRKHIDALIDEAVEAGISEDAIRDYIRELNLTPKQIKTQLQLLGIEAAQNAIERFITLNSGRVVKISVGTTGGVVQHAGGMVGSGPRRFHAGGVVPMRGDEVPIIAKRGERVLNPAQNRAYERDMRPAAAAGGGGVAINVTVPVYGDVTGDELVRKVEDTLTQKLDRGGAIFNGAVRR